MKYMGWGPRDLGYFAASPEHVDAVYLMMEEEREYYKKRNRELEQDGVSSPEDGGFSPDESVFEEDPLDEEEARIAREMGFIV